MPTGEKWLQYKCSQSNGGNSLCDQKQLIRKDVVEVELLADIKEQLLDPDFVKKVTKQIQHECRKQPKKSTSVAEIRKLDQQIKDLAETICDVGRSDILSAKLKDLEERREELASQLSATPTKMVAGAADQWKKVVSNLENLHKYARPDEVETAREALKGIIGEVKVAEEEHHVVAYPVIGNNVVYNSGAQKRT